MTTKAKKSVAKKRDGHQSCPAPESASPHGDDQSGRASSQARIYEFIRRQSRSIQPDSPSVRLVLRHLAAGNRLGQRIGSQEIRNLTDKEASAMAFGIYDLAESDAIGLGTQAHQFVLLSYNQDDREPIGRCIFEIPARTDSQDSSSGYYLDIGDQLQRDALSEYQKGLEVAWELLRGHDTEAFARGAHDAFKARQQLMAAEKTRLAKETK